MQHFPFIKFAISEVQSEVEVQHFGHKFLMVAKLDYHFNVIRIWVNEPG
jgi:hypothetical protein